ncbi:MAG: hypothetical protein ACREER_13130 [Alphaproteobacteria bacterium]
MSVERDVRAFLDVVKDLGAVLREEIANIRAMRIDSLRALQEPKGRLAGLYEDRCAKLAVHSGALQGVQPGLKAELGRALDEFKGLVADNARLLAGAREVNERLIRMIADAVARQVSGSAERYAPGGRPGRIARRPVNVPLTLDRQA